MTPEQAVNQFIADSDIAHRIIHGGENTHVSTDGGVVPSIATFLQENQQKIDEARPENVINDTEPGSDKAFSSQRVQAFFDDIGDATDPEKGAALVGYDGGSVAGFLESLRKAGGALVIGNAGLVFDSRQEFVTRYAALPIPSGAIVTAGGLQYTKVADATAISDLLGFVPHGDARPEHWGVVATGSDETERMHEALSWGCANGRKIVFGEKTYKMRRWSATGSVRNVEWFGSPGRTFIEQTDTAPLETDDFFVRVAGELIFSEGTGNYSGRGQRQFQTSREVTPELVGCLASISSRRMIHNQSANLTWGLGEVALIEQVGTGSAKWLRMRDPLTYNYFAQGSTQDLTITEVLSPTQVRCSGVNQPENTMTFKVSASGKGEAFAMSWDNSTKLLTLKTAIPGLVVGDTLVMDRSSVYAVNRPAAFRAYGIAFRRPVQLSAAPGALGFVGLSLTLCSHPVVENCEFDGFSSAGFEFNRCYRPRVFHSAARRANRAYDNGDGTGYGFLGRGNRFAQVIDCWSEGCRKGLDLQGPGYTELYPVVRNFRATGGGFTYTGGLFFPVGVSQTEAGVNAGEHNTGYGSHEGVLGGLYTSCHTDDVAMHVSLRGISESVRNASYSGALLTPVRVMFPDSVTVDGFTSTDANKSQGVEQYVFTSPHVPRRGVLVWNTSSDANGHVLNGQYLFKGFSIRELKGPFISVDRPGPMPTILFGANTVKYTGSGTFSWTAILPEASGPTPIDIGNNYAL